MIDSGLLVGSNISDEAATLAQRSIAFQIGIPLCVVSPNYLHAVDKVATRFGVKLTDRDLTFEAFCVDASRNLPEYLSFAKAVTKLRAGSLIHFPNPLYRQMKDHIPVRIYETLKVLAYRQNDTPQVCANYILDSCQLTVFIRNEPTSTVVFGPLFVEDVAGQGSASKYFARFTKAVENFNLSIEAFWSSALFAADEASRPRLYTNDYLLKLAFLRKKLLRSVVEEKISLALKALRFFESLNATDLEAIVSPTFFAKAVAGLFASDLTRSQGSIRFKTFTSGRAVKVVNMDFQDGNGALVSDNPPSVENERFIADYSRLTEVSFLNWSVYVSESVSQLRNWLETGASLEQKGRLGGAFALPQHFGRRVARFMATVFNAFECTIYRVTYTANLPYLAQLGAFSADKDGDERLAIMHAHMESVAGGPQRRSSISYRCMLENEVQYCQYFDYERLQAIPPEQTITFPQNSKFKQWGVSACAIPIRVNGILWGVLQLIGRRPHCFPEVTRARAAEVCGVIGAYLFRNELLASVYEINRTIANHDLSTIAKREAIERELSRMFSCKTFAIVRIDTADSKRPISVFLQSGRSDLVEATRRQHEQSAYLRPLMQFAEGADEVWNGRIGGDEFRQLFSGVHGRRFYETAGGDFAVLIKMRWELSAQHSVPGVIMLTYTHLMVAQENWREAVEFTTQYISTVTESLYSSDLWERRLRDKIGHELSKTALNLDASIKRLDRSDKKGQGTTPVSNHLVKVVMGDLSVHARALKRYVNILTTHRDGTDFDNDPSVYLIRQMRSAYIGDPRRKPVEFSDAYKTTFLGQRERFKSLNIDIPTPDSVPNFKIGMDELCLADVMSTLVDNILKYTKPNTSITIRESSTDRLRGVTISNVGLRLDDDEVFRVFDEEVRGRRAREVLPDQGKGLGLWFAQKAMMEWNCGLRHIQRTAPEMDAEYAWQDFTLGFLKGMLHQ